MNHPAGTFIPDAYGRGTLHQFNSATAYMSRAEAEAWCARNGVRFVVVNQQSPRTRNSEFRSDRRAYL